MIVVSITCFIGAVCFAFLTQQATHNYRNSYGEDYEHQAIVYAVLAVILVVIGFISLFINGEINMAQFKLTEKVKDSIRAEYENFTQSLKLDSETQSKLGQFFTPPELTIKMIEKFSVDDIKTKTVLDPCLGGGGLIAAMILAGADPKNCYGIELDPDVLVQARKRLNDLCDKSSLPHIPEQNLHQGDALINECYDFKSDYSFEKAKKAAADKASGLPPLFGHIKK